MKTPIKTIGKIIFSTILISGIVFGINQYQNIMDKKNYVEPYCAAKYQHNVDDYKTCKVMTPTQILTDLKDKSNIISEVVDLPTIKM